jgi:hypothetical protein
MSSHYADLLYILFMNVAYIIQINYKKTRKDSHGLAAKYRLYEYLQDVSY